MTEQQAAKARLRWSDRLWSYEQYSWFADRVRYWIKDRMYHEFEAVLRHELLWRDAPERCAESYATYDKWWAMLRDFDIACGRTPQDGVTATDGPKPQETR